MTGLVPFGRQKPSDSSQLLAVGHETGPVGPSVLEFLQTPVVRLQGPSPVLRLPSWPPPQIWQTRGSTQKLPLPQLAETVCLFSSRAQESQGAIFSSISTPPSSAADGTWPCF